MTYENFTKIKISNSVPEEAGRPPMARNRSRSSPGHVFEPPRAIAFDSQQTFKFLNILIIFDGLEYTFLAILELDRATI